MDPTKVTPKDAKEPFPIKEAHEHFMKTGQATDELFSNFQPAEKAEKKEE